MRLIRINFIWICDCWRLWFSLHWEWICPYKFQKLQLPWYTSNQIVTSFVHKIVMYFVLRNTLIWGEKWLNRILNQKKKLLEKSKKYFPMSRYGRNQVNLFSRNFWHIFENVINASSKKFCDMIWHLQKCQKLRENKLTLFRPILVSKNCEN